MLDSPIFALRVSLLAASVFCAATAMAKTAERRGADSARQIVCSQGSDEILRFSPLVGQSDYRGEDFSLIVRSMDDGLGSLTLTNDSGDVVEAAHGEGILSGKLITDEASATPISASTTQNVQGLYSLTLVAPSGDYAKISAQGRRGDHSLAVELVSDEVPGQALQITCRLVR